MNNDHKYDIDLETGLHYEFEFAKILRKSNLWECKTEIDMWKTTGNIAIEIRQNGYPSGLSTTEADWWAHLLSFKGNIESILMFPVDELKSIVKKAVKDKTAKVIKGGDGNRSTLVLLPINKIWRFKNA